MCRQVAGWHEVTVLEHNSLYQLAVNKSIIQSLLWLRTSRTSMLLSRQKVQAPVLSYVGITYNSNLVYNTSHNQMNHHVITCILNVK